MSLVCSTFILSLGIAVAASITPLTAEGYCAKWHSERLDTCLENVRGSVDFENNVAIVSNEAASDPSICLSFYANYSLNYFNEHMLMQRDPFPLRMTGPGAPPTCGVPSISRSYPYLEGLYLPQEQTHFVSYAITAALDLMWTQFKKNDPSFNVHFSVDMVKNILGENAVISDVLSFLKEEGVCSEEDYNADPNPQNPTCCTYRLSSYRQLRGLSSCDLAEKVASDPVYVELALDPQRYLLSLCDDSHPILRAINRYTVAGVITGFNNPDKYWNVLVRRHIPGHNMVKVQILWRTGFAAVTGRVYTVEADMNSGVTSMTGGTCTAAHPTTVPPTVAPTTPVPTTVAPTTPVPTTATPIAFHAPKCGAAYNQCWLDHPMFSYWLCSECVVTSQSDLQRCRKLNVNHLRFVADSFPQSSLNMNINNGGIEHVCVEDGVGKKTNKFTIDCLNSLRALRSVYVGEYSFTANGPNAAPTSSNWGKNKQFALRNCAALESVVVRKGAFGDFGNFDMRNTPLLRELQVGDIEENGSTACSNFCFVIANHYSWNNALVVVDSLTIGNGGFKKLEKQKIDSINVSANGSRSYGAGAFKPTR